MTVVMVNSQNQSDDSSSSHSHQNSNEQIDNEDELSREPEFPDAALARLDEMIHRQRWVVPVLPKCELELLLDAAIDLSTRSLDIKSEACQRFFREGLTISFTKILTDEAVNSWKYEIHKCIFKNCEKLVELVVVKLPHDWFPVLDLLAMVFNPNSKFHIFNSTRPSESMNNLQNGSITENDIFSRPPDPRNPRGWLVDLINLFGKLGGFQLILERFQNDRGLTVAVVCALLRPFGLAYEMLTVATIEKFFMPIINVVPPFLESLTDEELKKEAKNEAKNDALSTIVKSIKCLVSRIPNQQEMAKVLEIFRLKMILRLLQISSFNGKMNALNEVNKVIANVSYYSHVHNQNDDEEWLTAERMAEWIKENRVLQIVLRDSLHQPQYVEKLEKIIRFIIKEKMLSLDDLDDIWSAQHGKHEAIVKNVHDLLAKLAWDFSPEQLDHLFHCFQTSWSQASKKQREKLLELIRRLAEDDKDGVMAHKVLNLLWSLAHSDDVPTEIMDQAICAHVKILDYSCSQDRDAQKHHWLDRCVDELKQDKWVLPALEQIKKICCSYSEAPSVVAQHPRPSSHINFRHDVISKLQNQHSLVVLVADNLTSYMKAIAFTIKEKPDIVPSDIYPDGRYNHVSQIQSRLSFLRFLLKDGQLWLCAPQARQIWNCLAEKAVFTVDREACFKWFSKLMGDDPDLDPEINKDFFECNILKLDPSLLTEHGVRCFDRFFKAVNLREGKLVLRSRNSLVDRVKTRNYLMDDVDLIGLDYLWNAVLCSSEDVAQKAIELLRETFTSLGPRLVTSQVLIHEDFLSSCISRLRAMYDTVSVLTKDKDSVNRVRQETTRMCRVLKVMYEYISECDGDFGEDRTILPLEWASRGKQLSLVIRFLIQGRQPDELEIWTHSSDTIASIKRQIFQRLKSSTGGKIELYLNIDDLEALDDKKVIAQLCLKDDAILTAKFIPNGENATSSPDSSSDSSTGSPQHPYDNSPNKAETSLPGVIIANRTKDCHFLLQLADLGCALNLSQMRDGARNLLNLIPPDQFLVSQIENLCIAHVKKSDDGDQLVLESTMFNVSPSTVLYNLQILYALLMPALNPLTEKVLEFQYNFLKSGGVKLVVNMLTKNNFLSNADKVTKRSAFLVVLRIAKFAFVVVGFSLVASKSVITNMRNGPSSNSPPSSNVSIDANAVKSEAEFKNEAKPAVNMQVLQQALQHIPNHSTDCMLRNVAVKLVQSFHDRKSFVDSVWYQFKTGVYPNMCVVRAIWKMIWASACGHLHLLTASLEEIESAAERISLNQPHAEDLQLCIEGLEAMSIVLALSPDALESLCMEPQFHKMVLTLVVSVKEKVVRRVAVEQSLLIITKCTTSPQIIIVFIMLLFNVLSSDHIVYTKEYFQLLCGLLSAACAAKISIMGFDQLLVAEIDWLKAARQKILRSSRGSSVSEPIDEVLLEGHIYVTKELVAFLSPERKRELGGKEKDVNLIQELVEDFLLPFSKVYLQLEHSRINPAEQAIPVCSSQFTVIAAYDLLVTLCKDCVHNLNALCSMLTDMFYTDSEEILSEWEFLPPVGPRPSNGFVGLKNAGATCYMNSVIQQLFMIKSVRDGVLCVEGAATDPNEDFSGEERFETENNVDVAEDENGSGLNEENRKDYHIGILKQVQAIFAHLSFSKLQYYVPRGLWKHFKLQGEPVNLREQHDACEFYNILVESINEALKALGENQILNKVLGGSFSDQKICKTCPHRYSREEAFTVISIDIRNYSNLYDSLEQYVKGDLLEGDNAYFCEKCSKKVDTVKRICLKKLPHILAIQLKRFDYDWERECSVKFNDYFEFPRELDMEPFTVSGLARNGELIDYDAEDVKNESCSKYKLTGIVVHSGQATGGHYYSYILHKVGTEEKWYKFDDGDVSECKMENEEEMKNQCFGGEYMGEQVFDNLLKRVSYRKQKRWWNAYLLFYTRLDDGISTSVPDKNITGDCPGSIKIPVPIERSVVKQNVRFMHYRSQFSLEYFQFLKNLLFANHSFVCQPPQDRVNESEEVAFLSTKLASKFLFSVGLRTKKCLRGPAQEWYEALQVHLRCSPQTRAWFAQHVLFVKPQRFMEYLLECPAPEIRLVFSKLIILVAHCSKSDPALPLSLTPFKHLSLDCSVGCCLSDQLLITVLLLLKKEVAEFGRPSLQYFHLFQLYASFGVQEKLQLIKLNLIETLMLVALEDGHVPTVKYQYTELGRLYQVVSLLVRCLDVSAKCQSSQMGKSLLPNPYGESSVCEPRIPLPQKVAEILYSKPTYIKKIIDDSCVTDDTIKLLKFCCWENPMFTSTVLSEILWQISYTSAYELKPYCDLLLHMLLLEDSWQDHRIHNALKGIPQEREGLFDIVARTKLNYQKRAYQCVKCMVALFTTSKAAKRLLSTNEELMVKWSACVHWLNDEIDKRPAFPTIDDFYKSWRETNKAETINNNNNTNNVFSLERSRRGNNKDDDGEGGTGGVSEDGRPVLSDVDRRALEHFYKTGRYKHMPEIASNESNNGSYSLERSPSLRSTLEKAYDLLPENIKAEVASLEDKKFQQATHLKGETKEVKEKKFTFEVDWSNSEKKSLHTELEDEEYEEGKSTTVPVEMAPTPPSTTNITNITNIATSTDASTTISCSNSNATIVNSPCISSPTPNSSSSSSNSNTSFSTSLATTTTAVPTSSELTSCSPSTTTTTSTENDSSTLSIYENIAKLAKNRTSSSVGKVTSERDSTTPISSCEIIFDLIPAYKKLFKE